MKTRIIKTYIFTIKEIREKFGIVKSAKNVNLIRDSANIPRELHIEVEE